MGGDLAFYGMLAVGALALFALIIVIGIVMRFVKAPSGSRLRHAFGPLMGAGEKHQELNTGQKGLHDSVIESIQEHETKGTKRETGGGAETGGAGNDEKRGAGEGNSPDAGNDEPGGSAR
ncbi:hypothetical protein [Agromyces humatus]|uniref:Uncharacterized protein n=1 Tax=Agromyces humatus TaxID=279573 RepID=A0ABP4WPY7_9MICO|nr:hypothetical protein [Agromyces humatus]